MNAIQHVIKNPVDTFKNLSKTQQKKVVIASVIGAIAIPVIGGLFAFVVSESIFYNSNKVKLNQENQRPKGTFTELKDQVRVKKINDLVFAGKSSPLFEVRVKHQNLFTGRSDCGYHALKNGLVALGVTEGNLVSSNFKNGKIFSDIRSFIRHSDAATRDADVSITTLSRVWETLASFKGNSPIKRLNSAGLDFSTLEGALSMINYNASYKDELIAGSVGGIDQLNYFANLPKIKEALQNNQPFHHIFLMGSEGHWVTLLLEQNSSGAVSWYGMDSEGSKIRFNEHIKVLEALISNPDQMLVKSYLNTYGEDLQRKAGWIAGTKPDDISTLMATVDQNMEAMSSAIKFIEKIGLGENKLPPEIFNQLDSINKLAIFYTKQGIKDKRLDFINQTLDEHWIARKTI